LMIGKIRANNHELTEHSYDNHLILKNLRLLKLV